MATIPLMKPSQTQEEHEMTNDITQNDRMAVMARFSKPVSIRGVEYPSKKAAARALGVNPSTVIAAAKSGRLDSVGLTPRTGPATTAETPHEIAHGLAHKIGMLSREDQLLVAAKLLALVAVSRHDDTDSPILDAIEALYNAC